MFRLRDTSWINYYCEFSWGEGVFTEWPYINPEKERETHRSLCYTTYICLYTCFRGKRHTAEWWCTVSVFTHSNRLLPPASKQQHIHTHAHTHSCRALPPFIHILAGRMMLCDVIQWRLRLCKFYSVLGVSYLWIIDKCLRERESLSTRVSFIKFMSGCVYM